MSTTLVMDEAGTITIPASVREELGLHPGDSIELEPVAGGVTLRPVRGERVFTEKDGFPGLYTGEPMPESMINDVLEQLRLERDLANLGEYPPESE